MKNFTLLRTTLLIVVLMASATAESLGQQVFNPQTIQILNDGTLNMASWGAAYSTNIWSTGYIGFNLKKTGIWGGPWATASDGGNNGAAAVMGSVGGSLQFLTTPTFQPMVNGVPRGQSFLDVDMPAKVRMVLNEAGQLRIGSLGVSGPKAAIGVHSDYRLSVYGKITANSIYVLADNATNWADYVFADNYRPMSLPELETYVKANRHLPEVPTTCDVETQGIDVGAMNVILLKKVEELTLHLIELNKKVAHLEAVQAAQN